MANVANKRIKPKPIQKFRFTANATRENEHYNRGEVYSLTEEQYINLRHSCERVEINDN